MGKAPDGVTRDDPISQGTGAGALTSCLGVDLWRKEDGIVLRGSMSWRATSKVKVTPQIRADRSWDEQPLPERCPSVKDERTPLSQCLSWGHLFRPARVHTLLGHLLSPEGQKQDGNGIQVMRAFVSSPLFLLLSFWPNLRTVDSPSK